MAAAGSVAAAASTDGSMEVVDDNDKVVDGPMHYHPGLRGHPRFSVAPMMQFTDRHFRTLCRTLSSNTALYTEMVNCNAVRLSRDDVLDWNPDDEGYVVCQIGGNEPNAMAEAAAIAHERGYSEVNINCGCPSDRVEKGCFGASLMTQPELVGDIVRACVEAVRDEIPITVKCRLGTEQKMGLKADFDFERDYPKLLHFCQIVRDAGCTHIILHTRKAVLGGLSTDENRRVPMLCREAAWRLATDLPDVAITANGQFKTLSECAAALANTPEGCRPIAGVMVGRAACAHPWELLSAADESCILSDLAPPPPPAIQALRVRTRRDAIAACLSHCARELSSEYDTRHRSFFIPTPSEQRRLCTILLKPTGSLIYGRGSKKVKSGMWDGIDAWCRETKESLDPKVLAQSEEVVRLLRNRGEVPRERVDAARRHLPLCPVKAIVDQLVRAHLPIEWLDAPTD